MKRWGDACVAGNRKGWRKEGEARGGAVVASLFKSVAIGFLELVGRRSRNARARREVIWETVTEEGVV